MKTVTIADSKLRKAAAEGMDAFLKAVFDAINESINGELNSTTMAQLNASQVTLLACDILHDEVMNGGFVQLIHNGYGPFIFKNPLAKVLKLWGLRDLSKLIYDGHRLWLDYGEEIERDCTQEQFMALFERFPQFDTLDDAFVEHEEEWTAQLARYVDEHIEQFVDKINSDE